MFSDYELCENELLYLRRKAHFSSQSNLIIVILGQARMRIGDGNARKHDHQR